MLLLKKVLIFINECIFIITISSGMSLIAMMAMYGTYIWELFELNLFIALWFGFLVGSYIFKRYAYRFVKYLLRSFSVESIRKLLFMVYSAIVISFLVLLFYSYELFIEIFLKIEEKFFHLNIPIWIPYLILPLISAIVAFRLGEKLSQIVILPQEIDNEESTSYKKSKKKDR